MEEEEGVTTEGYLSRYFPITHNDNATQDIRLVSNLLYFFWLSTPVYPMF